MGTEMFFVKVDGHITESGQEDKLNSEKCGTGGPLGKTLNGYHSSLSMAAYEAIWEKDSGVGLKEVEAGGNGVQNPSSRVEIMICSSNTSGGYRVLLINESMHLDM